MEPQVSDREPDAVESSARALALLREVRALRETVERAGETTLARWRPHIQRPTFISSALNLAHYLALRRHDLRDLQLALMPWGLSSLGRIESRVMPNLDAVIVTLEALCGKAGAGGFQHPPVEAFFEGVRALAAHTDGLFGTSQAHRRVRIMVTLPTESATDYPSVAAMVSQGADCFRINCAHDSVTEWEAMILNVRAAERAVGRRCKVMMDLAGPKIRTGPIAFPAGKSRLFPGERVLVLREPASSQCEKEVLPLFLTSCTCPEVLDVVETGASVCIDDGKIRTRVLDTDYRLDGLKSGVLLEVEHTEPDGSKLKPEKGLNFPGTHLALSPLTAKDLIDLDFVAARADIVGYSFVQTPEDIDYLQAELGKRARPEAEPIAIVAKVETPVAVTNLPELIVHAAGSRSFGVMIARGDLAVEIGYERLIEIQEEILWLCEAAHVPVIWATQVLENLVKKGAPSRGEMTDAAMAERAECVMLNKGPFVTQAISILDDILVRMEAHQLKKTPQLRALRSW